MADDKKKNDGSVDPEAPLSDYYNNISQPMPALTPAEELELQKNIAPPPSIEDEDDGKSHKHLNFDSSAAEQPGGLEKLRQMLGSVGDRFSQNLAGSNKVIGDATDTMLDRIRMQNPAMSGPRLPDQPMPAELAESQMMGNGVMGSVAPVAKFAKLAGMLGKVAPSVERGAADAAYEAAQAGQAPLQDAIKAQQALSRSVDFEQRLAAQKLAARQAALNKLRGQ
jgi:hypothetical protein